MNRHTTEKLLRSVLSYAIAVLSNHFVISEDIDKASYVNLSDNTKNSIDLVSILDKHEKGMLISSNPVFLSIDTGLFTHAGYPKEQKQNGKLLILTL